jgi:hypothetical protein
MMRKFTQRVLISAAAEMAIIGAVGGVDLLGEAQADPTLCVNATELCQPQQMNVPLQPQMTVICQPTGPKGGASCRQIRKALIANLANP